MCELLAVSSSQHVDVKLSLSQLAAHGGSRGDPDGWGVAFLDATDAQIWRDPHPAKDNPWVACLGAHPISARLALAHIRRATRGGINLANTQPFVRELWGHIHAFTHNGMVPNVEGVSPSARFQPLGETDSEEAFCQFLGTLAETDGTRCAVRSTFVAAAQKLRILGPANLMYASGDCLLVHADRRRQASGAIEPPGLWLLERRCDVEQPMIAADAGVDVRGAAVAVIVVASVPLTNERWRPLERGTILEISSGRIETESRLD